MTDLTLFVLGFGIFGMCIGGTLVMSIGASQPADGDDSSESSRSGK